MALSRRNHCSCRVGVRVRAGMRECVSACFRVRARVRVIKHTYNQAGLCDVYSFDNRVPLLVLRGHSGFLDMVKYCSRLETLQTQ